MKYPTEIPGALRAHYQDIVDRGSGFSGKVKMIGDQTNSLGDWLWKTHLQKHVRGLEDVRDVQIMHRGGLFTGQSGKLGEPTLWVVDCRWEGKGGLENAWAYEDYGIAFEMIGRWMHACP